MLNFAEEIRRTITLILPGPAEATELIRLVVARRIQQVGETELRSQIGTTAEASVDDGNDAGLDEYTEEIKKSAAKDAAKTFCDNWIEWAK